MNIKKIKLVSNTLTYGPAPEPDEEVEQRLTVSSSGMVYFSSYNFWDKRKLRTIRKSIGKDNATKIFELINDYLTNNGLFEFVTDVGSWNLEVTYEDNTAINKTGSMTGIFIDENMISDLIDIENLTLFGGSNMDEIDF